MKFYKEFGDFDVFALDLPLFLSYYYLIKREIWRLQLYSKTKDYGHVLTAFEKFVCNNENCNFW